MLQREVEKRSDKRNRGVVFVLTIAVSSYIFPIFLLGTYSDQTKTFESEYATAPYTAYEDECATSSCTASAYKKDGKKYRFITDANCICTSYKMEPQLNGSAGSAIIDSKNGKVIGILSGVNFENKKREIITVPISRFVEFYKKF